MTRPSISPTSYRPFTLAQLGPVFVFALLSLSSCGGGGGSSSNNSGGVPGEQRYIGVVLDQNRTPQANTTVRLVPRDQLGQTDTSGSVTLVSDTRFAGGVDIEVSADWGTVPLTLYGVTTESRAVAFQVILDRSTKTATIPQLVVYPLSPLSVADSTFCMRCHATAADPDCSRSHWKSFHPFFNCGSGIGGTTAQDSCENCHGDRGRPQCDSPAWRDVHRSYPCDNSRSSQNPGGWTCTSCHGERGHTQCGNPVWEAHHGFVSCERGNLPGSELNCNSCHELRTVPLCDSPSWRASHPFWRCGNDAGLCTSCHANQGPPRCGDTYWQTVHDFYSCAPNAPTNESLSCSSCHAPKRETVCEDPGWKATHNFFGAGKDIGSTANLCSSCHENRGPPRCGDPTFRSFHCFCG